VLLVGWPVTSIALLRVGLQLLSEGSLAVHLKGGLHHLDGLVQLERPAAHNSFVDVPQSCTAKFFTYFVVGLLA
jgi:hypothetical protein